LTSSVQFIPTIKAEEKDLAVIRSKNYRLPLKRLYRRSILKNEDFRKYSSEAKRAEPYGPAPAL